MTDNIAVIAGVGPGLGASLARLLSREGFKVVIGARNQARLSAIAAETGATAVEVDVADPQSVQRLFDAADRLGSLSFAIFNAGSRARGPITELKADDVRNALLMGAYGGFLVAQNATQRLLARGSGSLFFTGATASVKGFARSSGFALPKFALRGLAQSLARELAPQNIHVAHFIIDGGIASEATGRSAQSEPPDRWLSADAIAETYLAIHRQHRSAWTWEVELRPWTETF